MRSVLVPVDQHLDRGSKTRTRPRDIMVLVQRKHKALCFGKPEHTLQRTLKGRERSGRNRFVRVFQNTLAQILKKMAVGAENDILTYLSQDDPDLGQDLRSRLFTMDDVVKSDDRFVQEKLREMTEIDIAYLIAAKPDDFREKILSHISAGRRAEVRAQEDILKPMRRSDCERITSKFFSKLRRAFEEGHLIIQDRNDDVFV